MTDTLLMLLVQKEWRLMLSMTLIFVVRNFFSHFSFNEIFEIIGSLQDCAVGLLFALIPVLGGTSGVLQGVISMTKS